MEVSPIDADLLKVKEGTVTLGKNEMVVGYEEAMIIQKGEFKKNGDVLKELERDVIVAGVLPKTGTALDTMHFVGSNFK